jgi:DNA recombination protein RmuC
MSKETINLTRALKEIVKCKVMGESARVLEKIRSRKGREYEVQQSFTTEEGNRFFLTL